jgi:diaminohydroxyphosphoribosylaminopyrimidine deaminase/5-amino-6-(5-phosphoribosylamino)uracil reductase
LKPVLTTSDASFMAQALRLAERGLYTTSPNPRVGAVMVNQQGLVVGTGLHHRAGEAHAERLALQAAGEQARGATAYVTLEPCCHQGRTPPCTDALIKAGVKRVVAAMTDPNPLVAGQGFARLREAGIKVDVGLMEQEAEMLNLGFVKRMRRGLPWVRCKLAMSLDGRTAMASGESQWITGPESRLDVQRGRARSCAILTGIGTLKADDPALNVRLQAADLHDLGPDYPPHQPLRVVLDPMLESPPESRLFNLPGRTLIFCGQEILKSQKAVVLAGLGVSLEPVAGEGCSLDLYQVMRRLAMLGLNEVWIESGATLAGAMMQRGVVDELIIYMAPQLLGDTARGLVRLPGLERLDQRIDLRLEDVRQIGQDLRLTFSIKPVQRPAGL